MKKINFIPRGGNILVTSHLVKKTTNLFVGSTSPEIKEIQQVVAVGPDVTNVKVGEWVVLDTTLFIQHIKTKSSIKAGIGGADMITEQVVVPFFSLPWSEDIYIKIGAREIQGVIINYDELPETSKVHVTLEEFTKSQKEMKEILK
jgi:hypothetical protein